MRRYAETEKAGEKSLKPLSKLILDFGSVVGFATWAETGGTIELEDLFVDPGYLRRGIATALVSCIAEIWRARGEERLEVTANPHALGFYRAVGFIDCGVAETKFSAAPRMELAIS